MTQTITIDQLQFVVAPEKIEPAPVESPKPKRTYCPDCGPKPKPATAICTPSRDQFTGVVAKRCKKHAWAKYYDDMARAKEKMYLDRLHRTS